MMRNNKPRKMARDLHKAILANDVDKVKTILSRNPDCLNAVNRGGRTALMVACKHQCMDVINFLLTLAGHNVNITDRDERSLLYYTAQLPDIFLQIYPHTEVQMTHEAARLIFNTIFENNRLDVLQALIAKGFNPNYKPHHYTILQCAVEMQKIDIVTYLLTLPNIDVNDTNPLVEACYKKNAEIIRLLANHPMIDVNLSNTVTTPMEVLHCESGLNENRSNCLKILLSHPQIDQSWLNNCDHLLSWIKNVNQSLFRQIICLPSTKIAGKYHKHLKPYLIIKCNHQVALDLLINDPEFDVNLKMQAICTYGNNRPQELTCIKALLCSPGIENWINNAGSAMLAWLHKIKSPLYFQVINLPSTQIKIQNKVLQATINPFDAISILVNDPDFDLNQHIFEGMTLLNMAINKNLNNAINLLLSTQRIDLHKQDKSGHSALTYAESMDRHDLVPTMLKHPRFNIDAVYHHQQNLLMLAAEKKCETLVRTLLNMQHFPINASNDEGNSALILLCQHHQNAEDATLFTELLNRGANPTQKNHRGTNAIMTAKNRNLKGIAHELKNGAPQVAEAPSAPPFTELEASHGFFSPPVRRINQVEADLSSSACHRK